MIEIKFNIGDKVAYTYSECNDYGEYAEHKVVGYIFAVEVAQEGTFRGKKGYTVRYKVHGNFEGIHSGWRYVMEPNIILLGKHKNAGLYATKL